MSNAVVLIAVAFLTRPVVAVSGLLMLMVPLRTWGLWSSAFLFKQGRGCPLCSLAFRR